MRNISKLRHLTRTSSKLRHLTGTSSVAKPTSIGKSCSHGKKDCKRQKVSSNLHDMKKVKLGEWQSVVSVMEDNVEHALSVNSSSQCGESAAIEIMHLE